MPPRYSQGLTIPDFTETSDLWLVTGIPHISITVTANTAPLIGTGINPYKTYTVSQDNRGTVSTRDEMFKTLPPFPPADRSPSHIPHARATLRLSTNKSTCARKSPAHTHMGFIPHLLAVPTCHHSISLATRKQHIQQWYTCSTGTQGVNAFLFIAVPPYCPHYPLSLPTSSSVHASARTIPISLMSEQA